MYTEHWLHVYQKPALAIGGTYPTVNVSDTFFTRYLAYDYKHKISAFGGDDSATARLMIPKSEAEVIFGEYVGNRVAVYADNPVVPIFEGIINRVNIEVNGVKLSRSLDGMYNRVSVKYQNPSASPETQITSEVINQDSIDVYGSKQGTLDAGQTYSNVTGIATTLRSKALNQLAWPQISTVSSTGNEYKCTIEMIGFYHTLDWDTRLTTITNSEQVWGALFSFTRWATNLNLVHRNSSGVAGNGWGVFFNDRDSTDFDETNAAFNITLEKRAGESALSFARKVVEAGDGTSDWVFQISRTVHRGGAYTFTTVPTTTPAPYRRSIYRAANTDVEYFTQAYGDKRIYTPSGYEVKPYNVLPDRSIFVSDILEGWNKQGQDPRIGYIETVDYDGNTGVATWQTKDSLRVEDMFKLRQYARSTNGRFGASDKYYAT